MKKNHCSILVIAISAILFSCGNGQKSTSQNKAGIPPLCDGLVNELEVLEKSMLDYMSSGNVGYTKDDVTQCIDLLYGHLTAIEVTKNADEALRCVKTTVEALNELNAKCSHGLIETSEREKIAQIIIGASHLKGYNTMEDDITEQWREW